MKIIETRPYKVVFEDESGDRFIVKFATAGLSYVVPKVYIPKKLWKFEYLSLVYVSVGLVRLSFETYEKWRVEDIAESVVKDAISYLRSWGYLTECCKVTEVLFTIEDNVLT